jgi:hypothetical protein
MWTRASMACRNPVLLVDEKEIAMADLKWLADYSGQTTDQLLALEGEYLTDTLVLVFEKALVQKLHDRKRLRAQDILEGTTSFQDRNQQWRSPLGRKKTRVIRSRFRRQLCPMEGWVSSHFD